MQQIKTTWSFYAIFHSHYYFPLLEPVHAFHYVPLQQKEHTQRQACTSNAASKGTEHTATRQ